jgi:hypothetical protein
MFFFIDGDFFPIQILLTFGCLPLAAKKRLSEQEIIFALPR